MNIPLSDHDIRRLLNDRVRIVLYSQLINFTSIESLFGPYDCVVILYERVPGNGHWTTLFRTLDGSGDLEFYDPYGGLADFELKYMSYSRDCGPHLSRLLLDYHNRTGHNVFYNDHQHQKLSRDINTCGRHCVVRIFFRYLNIEQYISLMKDVDVDKIVLNLTF